MSPDVGRRIQYHVGGPIKALLCRFQTIAGLHNRIVGMEEFDNGETDDRVQHPVGVFGSLLCQVFSIQQFGLLEQPGEFVLLNSVLIWILRNATVA